MARRYPAAATGSPSNSCLSVRDYLQTRLTPRPAPGVQTSPKEQQEAFASSEIQWFRFSLRMPGPAACGPRFSTT
jgi:hypothetical protein